MRYIPKEEYAITQLKAVISDMYLSAHTSFKISSRLGLYSNIGMSSSKFSWSKWHTHTHNQSKFLTTITHIHTLTTHSHSHNTHTHTHNTYTHSHNNTHTHAHTHTHTHHTHTHTHTHTQMLCLRVLAMENQGLSASYLVSWFVDLL